MKKLLGRRGLGILEVLFALAILSLFLLPLLSLASGNRREAAEAEALLSLWVKARSEIALGKGRVISDGKAAAHAKNGGLVDAPLVQLQVEVKDADRVLLVDRLEQDPYAGLAPALDVSAEVKP